MPVLRLMRHPHGESFPHFKPDYMVLTNLFRDQLDRYGEIDITMNILKKVMQSAAEDEGDRQWR